MIYLNPNRFVPLEREGGGGSGGDVVRIGGQLYTANLSQAGSVTLTGAGRSLNL